MFKKLTTTMRLAAVLGLVLTLALSTTWAKKPPKDDGGGSSGGITTNSYYKSKTMSIGSGWFTNVVHKGKNRIRVDVQGGALDNYLIEQGLEQALLWVYLQEEWIDTGDGSGYYQLHFTFGPDGAYFQEPLEIQMRGKYVSENNDVQMYDENGELLEFTSNGNGRVITYYLDHFSSYYYDDYDY